jgi:hypothetical protein
MDGMDRGIQKKIRAKEVSDESQTLAHLGGGGGPASMKSSWPTLWGPRV